MKQQTILGTLLVLSLLFSCQSESSKSSTCEVPAPEILDLGIFEQQTTTTAPFLYGSLKQDFHLPASDFSTLRFLSKSVQQDFILEMQLPEQKSPFGILLARDAAGERPIAGLQVIDGKILFAPTTQIDSQKGLEVNADYIRLEYINGQASAYYSLADETVRPVAIQQMEEEDLLYLGIFARATTQDLHFEDIQLTFPEIEPALSVK